VLFSVDDETPPVKIYSDVGSFEKLPAGLRKVLELELLEDNSTVNSIAKKDERLLSEIERYSEQWIYLTTDEAHDKDAEPFLTGAPGTSILTTTWHQDDPYNFCKRSPYFE
jgi:hypothetical protein